MNRPYSQSFIFFSLLVAMSTSAAVRYVNVNSASPTPPYLSWATAATTIQDAVNAAVAGDQVLVTNGVYQTGGTAFFEVTNRVFVNKAITIQSVNGPHVTIIQGQQVPGSTNGIGAARCIFLSSGARLSGFTLTNGATQMTGDSTYDQSGGGILCGSVLDTITNCVIAGNSAYNRGGGVYLGKLIDCILSGNSAGSGGGSFGSTVNNCTLAGNSAGSGGGTSRGILSNCVLSRNTASAYGGGALGSTLNNCTVTNNSAMESGGGVSGDFNGPEICRLNSCLLRNNTANRSGGGAFFSALTNCTVTGNSAMTSGGGVAGLNTYLSVLNNCIVYYNQARRLGDNFDDYTTLNFCCTTPLPFSGTNNLTAEPQLAGNWHLNPGSPCRGAGSAAAATGLDLDGDAWANPPSIGCDEYQSGSITGAVTVAILASYTNVATGFPVDFQELISGKVTASRWEFGDGTVVSNRPYASHAWNAAADYPVVLRAYSESYPAGLSATVTVHVVTQPVHYVALNNSSPLAPYTSWITAATNIQDAVNAATVPGALVIVCNGVYETGITVMYGASNRLAVTKPLRLESANGPSVTLIAGSSSIAEPVRCAYLAAGAMLSGFTLTNGRAITGPFNEQQHAGGGIYCEWPSAVVSNCVLIRNGAYSGGGAAGGTLNHCTVISNSVGAYQSGGGAFGSRLNACIVISNFASWGGGASECVLNRCELINNRGQDAVFFPLPFAGYGGGADLSILDQCRLAGNSASAGGGVSSSQLRNCTLIGNIATGGAYNLRAGGGGAVGSTLEGCTLVGNSTSDSFFRGGGANTSTLKNCILYFNSAPQGSNYGIGGLGLDYCCTTPMQTNGIGNITNAPLFVDTNGWVNLRLLSNSPCINAGNNAYVVSSADLDGRPRIVGGTVDMGAYEIQPGVSGEFIGWLSQFGLPTDGSADYGDTDSDLMNNWQEWIAGTVPTNAASALRLLTPTPGVSGTILSWQSVSNRTYFLERTSDLGAQPSFALLTNNIVGQVGTTSYTDTNAIGSGPFFYRVGVY
ncbi:MAG TPA: choice-of-anchor Q domain-containing protein [Verrucomicrobiae bacterium]|nr:choice-of-anchor Q domain-containing protein [Verrucomicrobiae bacterium]